MVGRTEAKAVENNFFVGQERWLGDQNRLETDVVLAVNDAFQRTFLQGCLPLSPVPVLVTGRCFPLLRGKVDAICFSPFLSAPRFFGALE